MVGIIALDCKLWAIKIQGKICEFSFFLIFLQKAGGYGPSFDVGFRIESNDNPILFSSIREPAMHQVRREEQEQSIFNRRVNRSVKVFVPKVAIVASQIERTVKSATAIWSGFSSAMSARSNLQIKNPTPRASVVDVSVVKSAIVGDMIPTINEFDFEVLWTCFLVVRYTNGQRQSSLNELNQTLQTGILLQKQIEVALVKSAGRFGSHCDATIDCIGLISLQLSQIR